MTYTNAKKIAQQWIAQRKSVRAALIQQARARHPRQRMYGQGAQQGEVRKLHLYPGDLSEARLMALAESKKK